MISSFFNKVASRNRLFGLTALFLCLLLPPGFAAIKSDLDISYGPSDSQKYDVWWDSENHDAGIVFMVHGGGWRGGDKSTYSNLELAEIVTESGCVLVSTNYRLLGSSDQPAAIDLIRDVWLALATFRQQAAKYGADQNRVIVGGSSAGSHLSAALAYGSGREWLIGTAFQGQESEVLAGIQGWYSDSSLVDLTLENYTNPDDILEEMSAAFNPVAEIDQGEPPAFCTHGAADSVTPVGGLKKLEEQFAEKAIDSRIIMLPGGVHMSGTRIIFHDYQAAQANNELNMFKEEDYQVLRTKIVAALRAFIVEQNGK